MRSRTQGAQEILKNIGCLHPHKPELGDGTRGSGPLKVVLHSNSFATNLWHGFGAPFATQVGGSWEARCSSDAELSLSSLEECRRDAAGRKGVK